jgi:hypothetical protein
MPIAIAQAAGPPLTAASGRLCRSLAAAVLGLEFADLWRTRHSRLAWSGSVRIDNQGPWSSGGRQIGENIQAQVGRESIAAVRLGSELAAAPALERATVVAAVRQALSQSCADESWYEVTGTVP